MEKEKQDKIDKEVFGKLEDDLIKMKEEFNFDGEDEKIASQGDYGNALNKEEFDLSEKIEELKELGMEDNRYNVDYRAGWEDALNDVRDDIKEFIKINLKDMEGVIWFFGNNNKMFSENQSESIMDNLNKFKRRFLDRVGEKLNERKNNDSKRRI